MDSTCRACRSVLDLTDEQVRQAVDEVLEETRPDIQPLPGTCPLCGRSSAVPVSHRKSIQFAVLVTLLLLTSLLAIAYYARRDTERQQIVRAALQQAESNPDVAVYLGKPVTVDGDVDGQVKHDETGWQEARLTIPVRGPRATGVVKLIGGRNKGEWKFTTLEVFIPSEHKRVDLVAGRIVDYDSQGYVEVHTQAVSTPEFTSRTVPPARWNGDYPCVSVGAVSSSAPRIGDCTPPIPIAVLESGPLDRFEVDLRFGKFNLRQTDLLLKDGDVQVPLTRTYTSQFWIHKSRVNAFGRNSTHDFDIAPVGSRNPYLYQMIVLPDGDFLYFKRISAGGGYADAVYQHSETSSRFHKAVISWDGNGWDTKLADGARIHFPESYVAKNMAQGAATRIVDAKSNTVSLIRDRQRNLQEIRTSGGRWVRFLYDDQARVVRAEDNQQRWATYGYGTEGLLTAVSHSDGRARHYTYVGDLLTWVRDETGRVLIHNWYRDWKVVRQDYSNGQSCQYDYRMASNRSYVEEATLTLPDGSKRSFRTGDLVPQYIKDIKPK